MGENNNNFKEKFQAFWNVKRNKIATIAGGSVLGVGVVLAIALPIALNDSSNSDNTSGGGHKLQHSPEQPHRRGKEEARHLARV